MGLELRSSRRVAAVEKAEAQKIQVVKAAEADAEAKFLAGAGGSHLCIIVLDQLFNPSAG